MDFYKKLSSYISAGVREYWIIDVTKKAVIVYSIDKNAIPAIYHFNDVVKVGILDDFEIDFSKMTDYDFGENEENL